MQGLYLPNGCKLGIGDDWAVDCSRRGTEKKTKEKNNIRAQNAGHGKGVESLFVIWRRIFGSWFGEFGHARSFFAITSLPLAHIRRGGRRRRNRLSRIRVLL
jgi:hypothetical protein